VYFVAIDLLVN